MTLAEVNQLSTQEKWELIELVWSSLRPGVTQQEGPAWHDDVLAERLREEADGLAEEVDLDVAFENIRNSRR